MVRNLLFDLGGVVVDLRRSDSVEAFKALGMADPDELLGEYSQKGVFAAIENGSATPEEFFAALRPLLRPGVSDSDITEAFNRFIVGIPERRLRALRRLREHYKVYILSNTNPIMWNGILAEEFAKDGHSLGYYCDGAVTSFGEKSMKPERKIFDAVVSRFGIRPEETLFLDDSAANVEAARRLGFQAEQVLPGTEFTDILASRGIA